MGSDSLVFSLFLEQESARPVTAGMIGEKKRQRRPGQQYFRYFWKLVLGF